MPRSPSLNAVQRAELFSEAVERHGEMLRSPVGRASDLYDGLADWICDRYGVEVSTKTVVRMLEREGEVRRRMRDGG